MVVVPATVAVAVWLAFDATVLFTGLLTGMFASATVVVRTEDFLLFAVFGAILWWRTACSGARAGEDGVQVRNVWRSYRIFWEEVAGFEVACRRVFGAGVRLTTTDHRALWCFGLQSRPKLVRQDLAAATESLNGSLRAAQCRLKLKKSKVPAVIVGGPALAKGLPRYRARRNPLYWPLPVVALLAVACSSAWEVVVPIAAYLAARVVVDRRQAAKEPAPVVTEEAKDPKAKVVVAGAGQ